MTHVSGTPRRIGLLGFDSVQALDLVGPMDAFRSDALATGGFGAAGASGSDQMPPYETIVIGLHGKRFTASSGLVMCADTVLPATPSLDTLLIPGGAGLRLSDVADRAADWIKSQAPHIRRVVSVCTGIYGLAPTGLLDGRRVTTHWSFVRDVQQRFPKLRVESDAIFLKDGCFYTSAGVSAGIDLALALIEEDLGPSAALAVAREMVVYFKRPGGQDQFSEPLQYQLKATDRFADLVAWIQSHLRADLSVDALAARTFLSPRQFARAFVAQFGTTPAAFVEEARLGDASRRLSSRAVGVAGIARSVGYASEDVFRRAFERRFGVTPRQYGSRFAATSGRRVPASKRT